LNFDEKPLLLFQKLKDAKKHPVFMLKHMREIQSPIAVAHQKHAARKAAATPTVSTPGHARATSSQSRPRRPPRLEVQGIALQTPLASSLSPQPGWPDPSALSPAVDHPHKSEEPDRVDLSSTPSLTHTLSTPNLSTTSSAHLSGTTLGVNSIDHGRSQSTELEQPWSAGLQDGADSANGVSYAVAIYPYMAEHSDEFDVMV
jgi:protein STE50